MKNILTIALLLCSIVSFSQDVNVTLKEALNLERSLKEDQALDKYKQALVQDPNNLIALIRCAELSSNIGGRLQDKKGKKVWFDNAKSYADKAYALKSDNADANYIMSVVSGKMTEVETENKKLISYVKDIKVYADKALSIYPDHAKANYAEGRWHLEMVQLNWVKRMAVKAFFGGLPEAKIEDAFKYMERCRQLDQYFVANYLDLAKAYKFDNKPSKAIEILQKLVKLPNRTAEDANLKAEGKKLLDELL